MHVVFDTVALLCLKGQEKTGTYLLIALDMLELLISSNSFINLLIFLPYFQQNLGLEAAGVKLSKSGAIEVLSSKVSLLHIV